MSLTVRSLVFSLVSLGLIAPLAAQRRERAAEPPATAQLPDGWADALSWRSIGPASMGGRITSLAVYEADPSTYYVGTATSGLLKTVNNGVTFEHLFDGESTVAIGDVQVSATDPNLVWVGTGEANPRNSVSYGDGVYKSTDGGKTWKNTGLRDSFQIGRIAIHPKDHDVVYVGALGRLYGPNEERGLFKTTDGGETWDKILYVDDKTGVIDVKMHPEDPDTLLVATYERKRDGFDGNAPAVKIAEGSGVYRTTDGGKTFEKIEKGLPTVKLGRVGLQYYRKNPDVVYAIVESELIAEPGELVGWSGLSSQNAETGAKVTRVVKDSPAAKAKLAQDDIVLSVNGDPVLSSRELTEVLAKHEVGDVVELTYARGGESHVAKLTLAKRPEPEENAEQGGRGGQGRRGGGGGIQLSSGLGGQAANAQNLQGRKGFEHGGVYRSDDGGTTWQRINSINPRPMYFSEMRVDPSDDSYLYVLGVSGSRSKDRGETFTGDATRGVHSDQHALWVDPKDGRHMIIGSDGGLYVTYDRCANWDHLNHMALGQFYHVAVGPRRDYWVYGGLQDNGTWGAPHRAARDAGPVNEDWIRVGGGDGFVVQVDANDPDQIYYESQNGSMGRTHLATMESGRIRPRAPEGTSYRFNWKTPFILSNHNSRIYYCAGNHVFRSLDRGDNLKAISPEITRTDRGSATALAESPRNPDVLYVGTDDGALWGTRDGGHTWTDFMEPAADISAEPSTSSTVDVEEGDRRRGPSYGAASRDVGSLRRGEGAALSQLIPGPRWVSSIEASRFAEGRAYVALDAHRSDDDRPYILVTDDFGANWRLLSSELPRGSTRVIREDLQNQDVLYVGTEFGVFVSLDRGQTWAVMNGELPTVRVDEFAQHATAGEMVVATHGRSLWIVDVTPVRQMAAKTIGADAHLYQPNTVVQWRSKHRRASSGARRFMGSNPSNSAGIYYSLGKDAPSVSLEIQDAAGKKLRTLEASNKKGLHRVAWDLRAEAPSPDASQQRGGGFRGGFRRGGRSVSPGTYQVVLKVGDDTFTESVTVEADPGSVFPSRG